MAQTQRAFEPDAGPLPSRIGNGVEPPASERRPQRDSGRERLAARDYYRSMARPDPAPTGRLKYHIDKKDYIDGCDHVWVAVKTNGMETGALKEYRGKGWVAARACDFPQLSGYGDDPGEALRRGGYAPDEQADDIIEIDGQLLMLRNAELSKEAEAERLRKAHEQVDTQMKRLELASRRSLGSKAADLMKVQYGRQYANPDNFDAEVSGSI